MISGGAPHSTLWVEMVLHVSTTQAEREESVAQAVAITERVVWLRDGPAAGLGRQHRFTRTVQVWMPSAATSDGENELNECDEVDGSAEEQLKQVRGGAAEVVSPANAQQEDNVEAVAWAMERAAGEDYEEIVWPVDVGELPPRKIASAIVYAAMTFLADIGLGWDGIDRRALARVSNETLKRLALILQAVETSRK